MDSLVTNENGTAFKQVVPNKIRCGSLNPYIMDEKDKCYCKPRLGGDTTKRGELAKGKFFTE